MFRRFMIVCWVLFSIPAIASLIGYVGYWVNEEPTPTVRPFIPGEEFTLLEDMTPEELQASQGAAQARARMRRDRSERREKFLLVTWVGGIGAGFMLLWNIIWHTAHWVWMGRKVE